MSDIIYDLETYPNCFTFVGVEANKKEAWVFEISDRKNQLEPMLQYLRRLYKNKDRMVGFNNVGFDYPVLHHIMTQKVSDPRKIYDKAMSIIQSQDKDERFAHMVRDKDVLIPQIDLFKIHHFDNQARATSLKVIEFNMRSDNIEDLPFPVGKELSSEQIDTLIKYNKHDVLETLKFYHHSLDLIKFREELTVKYKKNFMNHNDTKIGKDYFIMRLEQAQKGVCYAQQGPKRVVRQTCRKSIKLNECILPYVKFERPEFNAVLDWLKQQEIKETKGVFSDILECDLGEVAQYAHMVQKNKKLKTEPTEKQLTKMRTENPSCWVEARELKSKKVSHYQCWRIAENLNVEVDGFQYDFGTGGIHGSIESATVKSDDDYLICDWDVASYYPNLAIVNKVFPEHLSELFCDIYQDVYNQRKGYAKGTAENAMMKLALNGVYGDSNNQFSPFFDPKYTMTITINGQLSLCMLAEELLKIEGLSVIQINTDGVTVKVPRKDVDRHVKICKDWENLTGLELERNDYASMSIRDVNSYLAVYMDGKVKRKGAYEYDNLGWHQNHSALVVPMAAEHSLIHGGDIESFIRSHKDHMDFMLRVKVPRSSRLVGIDEFGYEVQEQNICRYYVSNSGVELIKIMPPIEPKPGKEKIETTWKNPETGETITTQKDAEVKRVNKKGFTEKVKDYILPPEERRIGIQSGQKVTVCNDIKKYKGDINYDYYIDLANKLVQGLKRD